MEETSTPTSSESSYQDNHQDPRFEAVGTSEDLFSLSGRILNGCDSSLHVDIMEQASTSGYLNVEETLESEDLLNNNKGSFEQDSITKQRPDVDLGDAVMAENKQSFRDHSNDYLFMSNFKEVHTEETQEAFKRVCDTTYRLEQTDKEAQNMESGQVLTKHNIETNIDLSGNNENGRSEKEQCFGTLRDGIKPLGTAQNYLLRTDLLKLQKDPKEQEETSKLKSGLRQSQQCNEMLEENKVLNDKDMTDFDMSTQVQSESVDVDCVDKQYMSTHIDADVDMTLSNKAHPHHHHQVSEMEDQCNNIRSINCEAAKDAPESVTNMRESNSYIKSNLGDLKPTTCYSLEDEEHMGETTTGDDPLINKNPCQDKQIIRNVSIDFPTKYTMISSQNKQGEGSCGKSKVREEHRPLDDLTRRLSMPLDQVDHIPEEVDAEEDVDERENHDGFLHFSSSQDRLDPRKERHRYVSDTLDPDVLHLLEMHLRKQQLVDIKEEREEELLELHINTEKPRMESFKGLRIIPPVLDMVLEEPELEHTGESLEEFSKTPSDTDSDEGNNICDMELGLMESLQHDLMSKTDKIDKQEIATIFQNTGTDVFSVEKSSQLKDDKPHHNEHKNDVKTKPKKNPVPQEKKLNGSQMKQVCDSDNGVLSYDTFPKCEAEKHVASQLVQNIPDYLNNSEECPVASDNVVQLTDENMTGLAGMGAPIQPCQQLNNNKVDVASCVQQRKDICVQPIRCELSNPVGTGVTPHKGEPLPERKTDASDSNFQETETSEFSSGAEMSPIPSINKNMKPLDISESFFLETKRGGSRLVQGSLMSYEHCASEDSDVITDCPSADQCDGVEEPLGSERNILPDPQTLKANANSPKQMNVSDELLRTPHDQKTLHVNLEEKMLSVLEKAYAVDCRSSHLQASAELLWQESKVLRDECKNLSKEAAELLAIINQQAVLRRHPVDIGAHSLARADVDISETSDTKQTTEKTLRLGSKAKKRAARPQMRIKGEDQLQLLRRKCDFLRKEAPEVLRELNSLQHQLKRLPEVQSKPMHLLQSLLWGGLVTGGTMLLIWWSTKQLG